MGLLRSERQITWPTAANSITLSTSARQDSEAVVFDSTDIAAAITVEANNQGTPTAGDVLDVYIKWTTGDKDAGNGSDDFDTTEHAQFLMRLDTVAANTPGENPAQRTVDIPVSAKGFKLSVEAPQAASRNIVVKSRMSYQRAS